MSLVSLLHSVLSQWLLKLSLEKCAVSHWHCLFPPLFFPLFPNDRWAFKLNTRERATTEVEKYVHSHLAFSHYDHRICQSSKKMWWLLNQFFFPVLSRVSNLRPLTIIIKVYTVLGDDNDHQYRQRVDCGHFSFSRDTANVSGQWTTMTAMVTATGESESETAQWQVSNKSSSVESYWLTFNHYTDHHLSNESVLLLLICPMNEHI